MTKLNKIFAVSASALLAVVAYALPGSVHAAAVSITGLTSTTTPVYVNTGLATTSRARTGDVVRYQLDLSGTPLIVPQVNILYGATLTGSTTMSGSGTHYFYATTTTSSWPEGAVSFRISVGGTTGAEATTTATQSNITSGPNVTIDNTGPTLSTISWNDVDASTEFSAGDTLVFTFNETMATTTIATGNADSRLGLSAHSFGTSPTVSWNTAGTQLTLTLASDFTVVSGDTANPSSSVFDAIGNADATVTAVNITDNIAPPAPSGLAATNFAAFSNVTLASSGSSQIRYTTDGTTPDCSTGTVYSSSFVVSTTVTVKAVACDTVGNLSSVSSAVYTKLSHGGGGGGSSSHSRGGSSTVGYVPTTTSNSTQAAAIAAKIAELQAALAALGGTPAAASSFTRDLDVGSEGSDVSALQAWLIAKGFAIPAGATGHFGAQTQAALAAWQKANGITPAVGFFGPKTRAAVGK